MRIYFFDTNLFNSDKLLNIMFESQSEEKKRGFQSNVFAQQSGRKCFLFLYCLDAAIVSELWNVTSCGRKFL